MMAETFKTVNQQTGKSITDVFEVAYRISYSQHRFTL
jgi:hypothetical protein